MEKVNEELAICSKCGQPIPTRKKMSETENWEQVCSPCLKQLVRYTWLNNGMDIH